MSRIEAPRGTHDIVPAEQPLWQKVTGEMERLCALSGYRRIQTPVFEDTDLFQRTSGVGSDVVQKEMYSFTDRSDRSLTLRHTRHNDRPLHDGAQEVLKHVARLWGFGVNLESVDKHGDITTHWSVTASELSLL